MKPFPYKAALLEISGIFLLFIEAGVWVALGVCLIVIAHIVSSHPSTGGGQP